MSKRLSLDAVDVGILWSRLVSIADEMVSALVRTSFSTMVRESGDYSCMLFDASGRLLSQGTASVPSFTGTGPSTLAGILEVIPADDLREGDVLVTNDPWIGTGHVYDINVVKPIFRQGKIVAYAVTVSHLADMGGIGYGTGAKDVYEEGIAIPPVKLFDAGVPNRFVFQLLESNVRFREIVVGDIYSNIAACNVAEQAVADLLEEYSLADLDEVADSIFALARSGIEGALTNIPKGTFSGVLPVEGLDDDMLLNLAVSIDVSAKGFNFDFSGTAPVVARGINVPICYTRAYCYFCFKTIVVPDMPNNQAVLDFVSIHAPDNCILNALKPNPTGGRHILGHYVAPLVYGVMAEAAPGRVQADSGMICQVNFRGTAPSGRSFSFILFTSGGYGAFVDMDGRAALPGPSNMIGIPIEVWEELTGISVLRKEILPDSGGAGRYQGGAGQIIELRNDTGRTVDASFFGSRTTLPARGFCGGLAGGIRRMFLDGAPVEPKSRLDILPGGVVSLHEAGGGGFGRPEERPYKRIQHDLAAGIVTESYVNEFYPVQKRERL